MKTDLACHNVKQFIVLSSLTVTLSLLLTMNDSYMNNTWKVFLGVGHSFENRLSLKKEAIGKFGHHCIIMSPRYTKITLTFGICRKRNRVGSEKRGYAISCNQTDGQKQNCDMETWPDADRPFAWQNNWTIFSCHTSLARLGFCPSICWSKMAADLFTTFDLVWGSKRS